MYLIDGKSEKPASVLVGVPRMEMLESPASWMCRAALSQGATLREFSEYLGLGRRADPDLAFDSERIARISILCGVPREHFEFANYMFGGLSSIDPGGERFLSDYRNSARYRYCPVCLHHSRVKHFMIHWRFAAWLHCPEHSCLMVDTCRNCTRHIKLPTDMLLGGLTKEGIATLDQCMACGHRLSAHWEQALGEIHKLQLNFAERTSLAYGRAVLASVYTRRVRYVSNGATHNVGFKFLLNLDELGLLPNRNFEISSFGINVVPTSPIDPILVETEADPYEN